MERSSFQLEPEIERTLAKATMWTYDGRRFDAPGFQLGMAPAGSMYSNVLDLATFMKCLFRSGELGEGRLLQADTLESMYLPQFDGQGFGLGFAVSELDGHRLIRHGGAIYGFATELAFLPEKELGVAVVTTVDGANSVVSRIAKHALRGAMAARAGKEPPEIQLTRALEPGMAKNLAGRYETKEDGDAIELFERGGRLWLTVGDLFVEVRALDGNRLVVDDKLSYGLELWPEGDTTLRFRVRDYDRVPSTKPTPAPEKWRGLIGEYGWDHNTLFILEKDGQLHALIEWFFLYPLEQLSEDVFAFPESGLYHGEKLIFSRNADRVATEVLAAGIRFSRRSVGTDEGETFQIEPLRPVDELREMAIEATPPLEEGDFREPDLVEVVTLDDTIKLDVRYATTNNFMGAIFYDEPKAFLQRSAAKALVAAHKTLKTQGYGVLIHDAYRPWYVTKMFWDATPESQKIFVANPENGSRHNRGAAVDITLFDLETGLPLRMVGGYDEFSERSYPGYPGGTSLQRWHRELLRRAMEAQGFEVYEYEWWHFDYKDWSKYPILNMTFDQLEVPEPVH
jgi:D-alanyl-D-alanine dipeptidase